MKLTAKKAFRKCLELFTILSLRNLLAIPDELDRARFFSFPHMHDEAPYVFPFQDITIISEQTKMLWEFNL